MLLYLAFLLTAPSAGADDGAGTGSCASDDSPLAIGKLTDAIEPLFVSCGHTTVKFTDPLLDVPVSGPHACACSLFRLQTMTTAS